MRSIEPHDAECRTAEKYNDHLAAYHDDIQSDEVVVLVDVHKDVEFVVEAPVVVLIEDLQPNEHVEDDGAHFSLWV